MRRSLFLVGIGAFLTTWLACSTDESANKARIVAPPASPATPALSVASFDVAEAGWGDAPVAVHFTWRIASTTGKTLTCTIDYDGDGTFDHQIPGCKSDTKSDPIATLPAFSYTKPGEHRPRLVVSDGENTVEATQSIFANKIDFATNTKFPEKMPGFLKAEATPNTKVVLTFASEAQVPDIQPGDILWGTSGMGYLIRAATARKAGATVTVEGAQAAVQEAIVNGFFGARDVVVDLDAPRCLDEGAPCDLQPEKLNPRRPIVSGEGGVGTQSLGTSRAPLVIDESGSLGIKLKLPSPTPFIEHSLSVGLQIKKFKIDISWGDIREVDIDMRPGAQYEFELRTPWELPEYPLRRFAFAPIILGVFPITPVIAPRLAASFKFKIGFTVGATLPFQTRYFRGADDVGKAENQIKVDPEGTIKEVGDLFSVALGAESEVKFILRFEGLFFGVAGTYVAPTFSVKGEATVTDVPEKEIPCKGPKEICGAIKLTGGAEVGLAAPWLEKLESKSINEKLAEAKKEFTFVELGLWHKCNTDGKECVADGGTDASFPDDADSGADSGVVDGGVDAGPPKEVCDGIDNDGNGLTDEGCPDRLTVNTYDGASPIYGYTAPPGVTGSSTWSLNSPYPLGVTGICGQSDGTQIVKFGGRWGELKLIKDTLDKPYAYAVVAQPTIPCGMAAETSAAGTDFDYDCPAGSIVERVIGRLGTDPASRLQQIQVQCARYVPTQDANGVWTLVREPQALSPLFGNASSTETAFDWTQTSTLGPQYFGFIRQFDGRLLYTGSGRGIYQLQAEGRSFRMTVIGGQ